MKTIELGHAVLYVRDLERSRHFYGEVLGLPEIGPAFPGAAAFSGGILPAQGHQSIGR